MQRYKLRLGDGTILQVDRAALGTWSMDERAMVQTIGSQRWQPLQQFLAHERALARQISAPEESTDEGPAARSEAREDEPPWLRAASRLGTFLSRCLDPIRRLGDRLSGDARKGLARESPTLRTRSLVAHRLPRAMAGLRLFAVRASRRGAGILGSLGLINPPSPSDAPHPPAASHRPPDSWVPPDKEPPSAATPPGLESPAPIQRPPAIGALPVLRLAPISEPVEENEVDGGDRAAAGDTEGVIDVVRAAWPRTRRILVVAALLAAVVWGVLAREWWLPALTRLGGSAFAEIDGRVRARHQAQGHEQALRESTEQIPHLDPTTLELVLTRSPTGMLGPAEVFRLAREAEDQGSSSLSADERRELTKLHRELLQSLSPVEREELRDYDRARTQRASFAFEDEEALRLFARGARALPSRSLERLRELSGKAIAATVATGEDAQDASDRGGGRRPAASDH